MSWVRDAARTRFGFIAVGEAFDPEEPSVPGDFSRGVVSTSRDGVNWSHSAPDVFDGAVLRKVVEYDHQLYVFGSFCPPDPNCESLPERASWVVWRSSDATEWEQLPQSAALEAQVIGDVVIAGGQMVALGQLTPNDASTIEWPGVVWRSADGITWSRSEPIEEIPGFASATSDGSAIVAIDTEAAFWIGSVWYSTDLGESWINVPLPNGEECEIRDVAAVDDGFVVVGNLMRQVQPTNPCSWVSSDGVEWTGRYSGNQQSIALSHVVAVGDRAVAVGPKFAPDGTVPSGAVLTREGDGWRRVGSLPEYSGFAPLVAAGGDGGAVVFGLAYPHAG